VSEQTDTRPAGEPAANGKPEPEGSWEKRGKRFFVRHPTEARVVWRRGDETIAEALARDAKTPPSGDRRPRAKKGRKPPSPPPPSNVDLRELEKLLTEALSAPAMACALLGDQWAADHFTQQAPALSRNLIVASERNPWLRRKLEALATGEEAAAQMLAMIGVAGALVGYAVPPIIWWLNLPVPERARLMFGIPPARERNPENPPDAEGPAPAPVAAAA
jgi:hypothetical protein